MTTFARSPLRLLEALATPHGIDRYLELVSPMLTVRELRAEVTDVHRSTADSVTLTLRPTRQWRGFRAGQFVQLTVEIDGVRRTRCYSPSCSQYRSDGRIEITVKAHPEGLVSQYLHANARPGLVVGLSQADGTFCLPDERPERSLLVSGGSGITPVLSMLRTLCDEGYAGEIVFLHYAYTAADVAHGAELQSLAAAHDNVRVVLVLHRCRRRRSHRVLRPGTPRRRRALASRRRDLPVRAARADALGARALQDSSSCSTGCTSRSSRRRWPPSPRTRAAPSPSRRAARAPTNTGAHAARTGRSGRTGARVRLPDGHLLLLHPDQDQWLHAQHSQRRDQQRPRHRDPVVHQRSGRRRRDQDLRGRNHD